MYSSPLLTQTMCYQNMTEDTTDERVPDSDDFGVMRANCAKMARVQAKIQELGSSCLLYNFGQSTAVRGLGGYKYR